VNLTNKVALVTGGASGLGQAACEVLVAQGAKVCIFDLNEAAAQATVAALGKDKATYALVDVTDEESVQQGIDHCVSVYGELHIVLNSAGIGPPEKIIDREGNPLPLAKFARIVNVNLFGTFNVMSKAAAVMAKNQPYNEDNGRGVVINVASVAAFDGQIGQPAYAASKAGVAGMTLPVAREFARYGIRVCTIAPGLFLTPLAQSLGEKVIESLSQTVEYPKRLGQPLEFGKLVAHIAENDYLNGEVIRLDGSIRMAAR